MTTMVRIESVAEDEFDWGMDVFDALTNAKFTTEQKGNYAIVLCDKPLRLIETHYASTRDAAAIYEWWLTQKFPGAEITIVGGDILE